MQVTLSSWHQQQAASPWGRRLLRWFHLDEWQNDGIVSAVLAVLLLVFAFSLSRWSTHPDITLKAIEQGSAVCPPYFQQCTSLYFLEGGSSYSFMTWYAALFAVWMWAVVCWSQRWTLWLFMALLALYGWESFYLLVLSFTTRGNYDYYHLIFGMIALFLPNKRAFSQITFVLLYFLSATVKFNDGWLLGTYFSSLQEGMPLVPRRWIPVMTHGVIWLEMLGCWALLSSKPRIKNTALILFVLFHLYSTILVGFQYPITTLPLLLVLFAGAGSTPLRWTPMVKNVWGWLLLMLCFGLQFVAYTIPGERTITLEGNELGLYMFDANHQCASHEQTIQTDGTLSASHKASTRAWYRCDPYATWYRLKHHQCALNTTHKVDWQFDHSINGSPFYRLVDTPNVCTTEYHWLQHQPWLRTPAQGAQAVGRSVQNHYW